MQGAEKEIFSGTKDEVVVRIPPVARLRIVRVEPQIVVIPIEVEHIRVAITVSYVCRAIHTTARENTLMVSALYFMLDQKSTSVTHQISSFF